MKFDTSWKTKWHLRFAWLPVRVSAHEYRWLELLERQGVPTRFGWLWYWRLRDDK